jgi:transcriptional regulator with XRE-family HTH domain
MLGQGSLLGGIQTRCALDSPIEIWEFSPMAESVIRDELRRRMEANEFNQKSLARAAQLNETAVRDILKGRSKNPRVDTLQAIAKVLGCTVNDLIGETGLQAEVEELKARIAGLEAELAALKSERAGWTL